MRRHRSAWVSGVLIGLLAGCGGTTFSEAPDSGSQDAGHVDAHHDRDSAPGEDGSSHPDVSQPDTGVHVDASQPDTSVHHEAGLPDARHPRDTGVLHGCPPLLPVGGQSCSDEGLACEYGNDPQVSCDTVMTCTNGAWIEQQGAKCTTQNPTQCPAAFGDITQGNSCDTQLDCYYPQARCTCEVECFTLCAVEPDGGPNMKTWACDVPSPPTLCPIPRPRIGSTCSAPAMELCDYGMCEGNVSLECDDGVWTEGPEECPG